MGRPLFSHVRAPVVVVAPQPEHADSAGAHTHTHTHTHTHYEKWTYGAFDPDSDEFFEGAVYEAFLGPEDAINVSASADRDRDPDPEADADAEHDPDADDLPGGWGRRIRMLSPSERVLRLNEIVSRASAVRTPGDRLDPDQPPFTTAAAAAAEYFVPAAASPATTPGTSAGSSAPASPTQRARVHTSDITPIPLPSSVARAHPPQPREPIVDTASTGAAYFLWPYPTAAALPRQPGEPARAHVPAARGPRWPVF